MPPAIVLRLPMCVRFGPVMPTMDGLPAITWQPAHAPPKLVSRARPLSASPLSDSSNVMPGGMGVLGRTCGGSFSRGNATKPACCTVPPVVMVLMSCAGAAWAGAAFALVDDAADRGRVGDPPTGLAGIPTGPPVEAAPVAAAAGAVGAAGATAPKAAGDA